MRKLMESEEKMEQIVLETVKTQEKIMERYNRVLKNQQHLVSQETKKVINIWLIQKLKLCLQLGQLVFSRSHLWRQCLWKLWPLLQLAVSPASYSVHTAHSSSVFSRLNSKPNPSKSLRYTCSSSEESAVSEEYSCAMAMASNTPASSSSCQSSSSI